MAGPSVSSTTGNNVVLTYVNSGTGIKGRIGTYTLNTGSPTTTASPTTSIGPTSPTLPTTSPTVAPTTAPTNGAASLVPNLLSYVLPVAFVAGFNNLWQRVGG